MTAASLVCWTGLCGLAGSLAVLPAILPSLLLSSTITQLTPLDWVALTGLATSGLAGFVCTTFSLRYYSFTQADRLFVITI